MHLISLLHAKRKTQDKRELAFNRIETEYNRLLRFSRHAGRREPFHAATLRSLVLAIKPRSNPRPGSAQPPTHHDGGDDGEECVAIGQEPLRGLGAAAQLPASPAPAKRWRSGERSVVPRFGHPPAAFRAGGEPAAAQSRGGAQGRCGECKRRPLSPLGLWAVLRPASPTRGGAAGEREGSKNSPRARGAAAS